MLHLKPTSRAAVLAFCAAALSIASPAAARTYRVAGSQVTVDENAGIYKVRGGLVGKWTVTSFEELATSPIYHAKGTEEFKGCINRRRDRSCKGDPSGTLSFNFEYWAQFASPDPASLVWGACWHPVASGTGDLVGAQGVIQMVDTPTSKGVKTGYIGTLTLTGPGPRSSARAATRAGSTCGPTR